ncbi:MAG: sensor histidine kinase, partial [Gemmatimonadetes bacterium]|nr:sensor histidine kinase [Gemmatimonadota bacterium]
MSPSPDCPLASILAHRLRADREELVTRWLDRIAQRVAISRHQIFPTDDLLDHVPLLIDGIASYLEDPVEEITADVPVIAKAMELGELRYDQGSSAHQILWEYEILGGVLFSYLVREVEKVDEPCSRGELFACAQRIFRAIAVIQQFTTDNYLRLTEDRTREREEQLRRFNRAVSHELKNRLGAAGGAISMLQEAWVAEDEAQRARFLTIAASNVAAMGETLNSLLELSKLDSDSGPTRNTLLPDAAAEVRRRLRDFARARGVKVELASDRPWVEVPAAAVELALSNYLTNAVKYHHPAHPDCWARVEGEVRGDGEACEIVVRVRDNGLGVPPESRAKLFERFFRVHPDTGEEGSGLGLSLVRETIEAA